MKALVSLFLTVSVLLLASPATAELLWNGSTTGGGSGTSNLWDTSTANWSSDDTYGDNVFWVNGTTAEAAFAATAGTVGFGDDAVEFNRIRFAVNNYTLSNTGTGTFTAVGTTPTIDVVTTATAVINKAIAGTNGLRKVGDGRLRLQNTGNSFSGTLVVAQGILEAVSSGTGNQDCIITAAGSNSFLGSGTVTIDGGTLELTTKGTGLIRFQRPLSFGAAGGLLDVTNSNPGSPHVHGGRIDGGSFSPALTLGNTAGNTAVVAFNGGQLGLSATTLTSLGDWNGGQNRLAFSGVSGTGALRIELSNGALYLLHSTGTGTQTINYPLTIRGVAGGDVSSGPSGTNNSGIAREFGRVGLNNASTYVFNNELVLENSIQLGATGAARAIDGNIRIRGIASGNPANVAFSGRATGTAFGTGALNAPGATGTGHNVLYLGQGGNDTLTIEDGGVAALDLRVRCDQGYHNGVLLNAKTVIQAGGTLAFKQSLSTYSTGRVSYDPLSGVINFDHQAVSAASVGMHIVQGSIEGQGPTLKESVIDLYLPFDDVIIDNQPLGGVNFEGTVGLIVNGSGYGGLRVNGIARPDVLFETVGPDPVSNADKVANLLSAARLAGLTGTGGYLTPAPDAATFVCPDGGEWALGVPVGLKVIDNNPGGADVSLASITSSLWQHNLLLDDGLVEVGAGGMTFSALVGGSGGFTGGAVTVAAAGTLAPGKSAGAIDLDGEDLTLLGLANMQLGGTVLAGYDRITGVGTLNFGGDLYVSLILGFNPQLGDSFKLFEFAGYSGAFSSVSLPGLDPGLSWDTSGLYTAGEINVVPEPGVSVMLLLGGAAALWWRVRRRRAVL